MKYFILLSLMLSGCATGSHGTFVSSTHIDNQADIENVSLGKVRGESSQTWLLYVFPIGESPSTTRAIESALSEKPHAKFLANVAIDDRAYWYVGYSKHTITVEGEAKK